VVAPNTKQLLARLEQVAELLRSPDVPEQLHRASALAISISQAAPSGMLAGLALQLVAAIGAVGQIPEVPVHMVSLNTLMRQLREALLATDHTQDE
jgi:hypothetical protein